MDSDPKMITAAQFDESDTRLTFAFVGVPPEGGDMTVPGLRILYREQLIEALQAGERFKVAFKQHGAWHDGGELVLTVCDGESYVRIDTLAVAIDDLGNLARIRSSM